MPMPMGNLLCFVAMEITFLIALVVAGGAAWFGWQQWQKAQQRRFAVSIACSLCGEEPVQERGMGSYHCPFCGYDTDATYPENTQTALTKLQNINISLNCLDSAISAFNRSRMHIRYDKEGKRREVGPYADQYLEGIEQAEEVCQLCTEHVDAFPDLQAAMYVLKDIPPPPDDKHAFNSHVDQATGHVSRAMPAIRLVQRSMRSELKKLIAM